MFTVLSEGSNRAILRNLTKHLFCRKKDRRILFRAASQLYPMTSRRWDEAMTKAETIAGPSCEFPQDLKERISGEFSCITEYLQKLVGTSHPILETAKRCSYISEGRMGSAQARGLTVILMAKAIKDLYRYSSLGKKEDELFRNQMSLAEMTELTFSAFKIHRGIIDLKMHGLECVDFVSPNGDDSQPPTQQAKDIHYGNKVSILCGDFLLSYVMKSLCDLFNPKVVELVSTSLKDFTEGEFLLLDDWRSQNYLLSEESRDLERWKQRAFSTIGSLQGNTCQATLVLADIHGRLQRDACEFGKSLGYGWQAHIELQPLLRETYEPIKLPDMQPYPAFDLNCLPVILFMRNAYQQGKNFRWILDEVKGIFVHDSSCKKYKQGDFINQHRHQEVVNYKRLHDLIIEQDYAIKETYKVIQGHSENAIRHLESFPTSDAKEALCNICESLYKS